METSSGADLAVLLLDAFGCLVDEVVAELARRGHPGVTASHEFALKAIDQGADSASALGAALGVSKQAAAKTIAALEHLGYVDRAPDRQDARRKRLQVTARGHEMADLGGATFDRLRQRWAADIGPDQVEVAERALRQLVVLSRRSAPGVDGNAQGGRAAVPRLPGRTVVQGPGRGREA